MTSIRIRPTMATPSFVVHNESIEERIARHVSELGDVPRPDRLYNFCRKKAAQERHDEIHKMLLFLCIMDDPEAPHTIVQE